MSYLKNLYIGVACCSCMYVVQAQETENTKKPEPFTINGSVGASANFYSSNEPVSSRPPSAWSMYGNFTPKVNGFLLPFSFVVNHYGNTNASPFMQFGISPTYKWASLHLGNRYLTLSPLTFDGQSFKGAGIELNPKMLRFAAFYGKLNRAVNEDTSSGRFAIPQFSRTGYGTRIGIGNASNFFDLIYFHAKDDSGSVSFIRDTTRNLIRSQENTVLGFSFKRILVKNLVLSGDMALSGLTRDLSYDKTNSDSTNELGKLIGKILPYNASSIASYAGQATLAFNSVNYNGSLGYRRVQPDFKSLGTPYMLNDNELISWLNNIIAQKGKVSVSTSLSFQHDNLNKKNTSELQTLVATVSTNVLMSQQLSINMNYSGYNLQQKDSKTHFTDTTRLADANRLSQQIMQFSLSPTYSFTNGTKSHTVSGNVNLSFLEDKNPVSSSLTDSKNFSSSSSYILGFLKKSLNVSLNGSYNRYRQGSDSYTSYGATVGASAQLLKTKSLNIQGDIGYFFNRYTAGDAQDNITFSASAGYNVKHHSFNLFANYIYTPPNAINAIINKISYAVATKNLAGGISYNYSF